MANTPQKKRKKRRQFVAPPRTVSARLYLRLAPRDIALFRFLLEAHDNLAIFTMVDRRAAVLLLRFSPDQEREVLEFIEAARTEMNIDLVLSPA
ncbi:MAG: DUF4911 domain-containing protein [Proteobacteria bacterium]|nr:DUF4911 domain-containing protein [Pseudomonadota bacterium]MBU1610387.1 DUF4911 domain-containing protein [Pseudomonadota bacterium]